MTSYITYAALTALLAVGVADLVSTRRALMAGAVEANPVMAFVQDKLGPYWGLLKITAHGVAASLVLKMDDPLVTGVALAAAAANAYVVFRNFKLAASMK